MPLYAGETMAPTWTGASGTSSAGVTAYLNSATVTYQLYESDKTTVVSGGSGSLTYVAASDGNYRGTLTATVTGALVVGRVYWLKYTLVSAPYNGSRWEKLVCEYRGAAS